MVEQYPVKILLAVDDQLKEAIDEWRRFEKDLPGRTEAIRRLIKKGLEAEQSGNK